jgi:hypothetical protein
LKIIELVTVSVLSTQTCRFSWRFCSASFNTSINPIQSFSIHNRSHSKWEEERVCAFNYVWGESEAETSEEPHTFVSGGVVVGCCFVVVTFLFCVSTHPPLLDVCHSNEFSHTFTVIGIGDGKFIWFPVSEPLFTCDLRKWGCVLCGVWINCVRHEEKRHCFLFWGSFLLRIIDFFLNLTSLPPSWSRLISSGVNVAIEIDLTRCENSRLNWTEWRR